MDEDARVSPAIRLGPDQDLLTVVFSNASGPTGPIVLLNQPPADQYAISIESLDPKRVCDRIYRFCVAVAQHPERVREWYEGLSAQLEARQRAQEEAARLAGTLKETQRADATDVVEVA